MLVVVNRLYSNKVDAVIGVSNFILNKHLSYGYFSKVILKMRVYNPVVSDSTPIKDYYAYKERKAKAVIFGFVGSLSASKGIEIVLNVFSRHLKKERLLVYGTSKDKHYEAFLKDRYKSETISFEGYKPQSEIYSNIDVLLVPSLWNEPLSRVIIEAYLNGIPVVAAETGGLPEIVKDGRTGFLFKAGDEQSLLKILKYVIENKDMLNFMKENCIEASKEFMSQIIAKSYIDIYNRLLERKLVT